MSLHKFVWALAALVLPFTIAANAADSTFHEITLGNPKAKVTVIEFASLTCPHCAAFAEETFPDIKKNYIDKGKIKFVFRDFPTDQLAVAAAMLARCAPDGKGMGFVETMFKNQATWARSQQPIEPLREYARGAGMTDEESDACLKSDNVLQAVRSEQNKASTLYSVDRTPTFYIDDEKVVGEQPFSFWSKALDEHIKQANAPTPVKK